MFLQDLLYRQNLSKTREACISVQFLKFSFLICIYIFQGDALTAVKDVFIVQSAPHIQQNVPSINSKQNIIVNNKQV